MASTTTGLDPWLGFMGTSYVHELTRQAFRIAEEMTEEAVSAPNVPRVVDVVRKFQVVSVDTALGVPATWQSVAGLSDLQSLVFYPRQWHEEEPAEAKIKAGERVIVIADVPAGGKVQANKIALTDRIKYDDPTYGQSYWEIQEVQPISGPGLVRVKVAFDRQAS
tara:strand:- start:378 stop:872 length:495 start_codon:yes stop_codon:yes gene_type:complete